MIRTGGTARAQRIHSPPSGLSGEAGRRRHLASALALAGLLVATIPIAGADDDRFSLTISGFRPTSTTEFEGSSSAVPGETLNLEEDFDLARKATRTRIEGMVRLTERQRLVFVYYNLKRKRSLAVDEEFTWNGQHYDIDTLVKTRFDFSLATLSYEYAFIDTPKWLVAGAIGAHWAEAKASITAEDTSLIDEKERTSGGSPALGLRVLATPTPRWRLSGYAQAFKARVDGIDARFTRAGLAAEYRIWDNLGVQLGYDWFKLSADYAQTYWSGKLDIAIRGPTAGVTVAF